MGHCFIFGKKLKDETIFQVRFSVDVSPLCLPGSLKFRDVSHKVKIEFLFNELPRICICQPMEASDCRILRLVSQKRFLTCTLFYSQSSQVHTQLWEPFSGNTKYYIAVNLKQYNFNLRDILFIHTILHRKKMVKFEMHCLCLI